jgi:peptidoglycan/LPS O-acetylase OafA/YrhL
LFDHRWLHNWADNWYVWGRTPLALSFLALTVGSLFAAPWWRAAIANPAFAFISVISYNLYLWHTVVIAYVRTLPIFPWHGRIPPLNDPPAGLAFELTAIALAIAVAVIPTYLIERPLLRLPLPGQKRSLAPASATASGRS